MNGYRSLVLLVAAMTSGSVFAADPVGEDDIKWDPVTLFHKQTIIAGLNILMRDNPKCAVLDPQSIRMDMSRGNPDNPAFAVDCGEGDGKAPVYFSKIDVESAAPPPKK
jgi:hypothetical protein